MSTVTYSQQKQFSYEMDLNQINTNLQMQHETHYSWVVNDKQYLHVYVNIMSIKGGLDTKVVLILRWSLFCCGIAGFSWN